MHKLLLADASAMMHRIIELTFSRENVRVISAADGVRAMALLEVERPDIVLADHALPGQDGYAIAAFVKTHPDLAHVPVLLLAGAFEPVDKARAAQVGCDGVLVKPFEPQQVIARVRELIDARPPATVPGPVVIPPATRASILKLVEPSSRERQPSAPPAGRQPEHLEGGESLNEYFDRLDAALGSLEAGHGMPTAESRPALPLADRLDSLADAIELPTMESLLADVPPSSSESAIKLDLLWPPSPAPSAVPPDQDPFGSPPDAASPPTDVSALVQALEELREIHVHRESPHPPAGLAPADPGIVTEEMIDHVTRRVAERLAPDAVSRVVTNIVTEVAERLVREEIDRIRGR